jgi:hypothetical protein
VDRFLKELPAEYDSVAIYRGELELTAAAMKGKSVIEKRIEFEQTFQIALEALLRDMELDLDKDDLEEQRNPLISRVRIILSKRQMKPADACVAALREDRAIRLAADSLRALDRLRVKQ